MTVKKLANIFSLKSHILQEKNQFSVQKTVSFINAKFTIHEQS